MTESRIRVASLPAALFLAMVAIAFTPPARAADANPVGGPAVRDSRCPDIYHCPNFATTGDISKDGSTAQPAGTQMATPPQPTDAAKKAPDQPQK